MPIRDTPEASQQVLPDGTTLGEARGIFNAGEEFLRFFDILQIQLRSSTALVRQDPTTFEVSPLVLDIISAPNWRQNGALKQRIRACTRMACLFYLAAAKSEFRNSQDATTTFLEDLHKMVSDRVTDHFVCSEELLYFLFYSSGRPDDQTPDRSWRVSMLMGVAKRLSAASWGMTDKVLSISLGLAPMASSEEQELPEWDADDLRHEIYGELYPLWTTVQQT